MTLLVPWVWVRFVIQFLARSFVANERNSFIMHFLTETMISINTGYSQWRGFD